jgi:hypothetical protein
MSELLSLNSKSEPSLQYGKQTINEVMSKLSEISTLPQPTKNKGFRGIELEKKLGINQSSDLLDCIDGDIKTRNRGQTMKITSVKHCLEQIIEDDLPYEESKLGKKMKNTLMINFNSDNNNITYEKHSIHNDPKLSEDYDDIKKEILKCYKNNLQLHTCSGRHNFLQIRSAASKRSKSAIEKDGLEYVPLKYKGVILYNKGMAFYIRTNYFKNVMGSA